MPEERKLVTVLFADLVESTARSAPNDPEIVRRVLARTFEEMRAILREHGGTVEKFIGDAVMAVFGVPQGHDDDAERALRAALALRRRVTELNADAPLTLQLHIGVNSGEVVAGTGQGEEFLVTGISVTAAARLQEAAAPGEILVGSLTRQLTERSVRYAVPRFVAAKGIEQLEASPVADLISPLPDAGRAVAGVRAPLIGRDRELAALLSGHRHVSEEGRPRLCTVFGVAGIGKSRLVAEFVERIGHDSALGGRCLPYGRGISYWPIQEILRADARIEPSDGPAVVFEKIRSRAREAFGPDSRDADGVSQRLAALVAGSTSGEGPSSPQDLAWAMQRYLDRRARQVTLTLVFEDIHWAEPALLDLIEHVVEWGRGLLYVVGLARPELLDLRPGWGGGRRPSQAIDLQPLAPEETRALVAELLAGESLPEPLRTAVLERTEGNPLYVEEFVRLLLDSGRIVREGGAWVVKDDRPLELPATLQALIAARLDRLAPADKRALQRAAVVGKVFWSGVVRALSPEGAEVDRSLAQAARRDFVVPLEEEPVGGGRTYRFHHILIRDVAYASLPKEERARLHDGFGRWLESLAEGGGREHVEVVTYHAEQAFRLARELRLGGADELGRRAYALLLARAREDRVPRTAREHLEFAERAVAVGETVGMDALDRLELGGRVATLRHHLTGDPAQVAAVDRVIEEARSLGAGRALVELLLYRVVRALEEGALDFAVSLHREARAVAERVADPELVLRAMVALRLAPYDGSWPQHESIHREALAFAVASALPTGALNLEIAAAASMRGAFGEARRLLEEAALSDRLSDRNLIARRWHNFHRMVGDSAEAIRWGTKAVALARELGALGPLVTSCQDFSETLLDRGEAEASRAVLEEGSFAAVAFDMRDSLPELHARLARAYLALGDVERATVNAEEGVASALSYDISALAATRSALAEVRAAQERIEEADALFRDALGLLAPTGFGVVLADHRVRYAEFLMRVGRGSEARPQLEAAHAFFDDPLAQRRREQIDTRIERCRAALTR